MRILVAGIGNVFLGDDAFGVEAVARLAGRELLAGVEVADFGIRGFDLAYALMDGYDAAILVDAVPRGEPAGTLCVLEPRLDGADQAATLDSHAMNPMAVLAMVRQQGGTLPPTWIVGCEPGVTDPEGEGHMGLSEPVAAAVDSAADLVEALVRQVARAGRRAPEEGLSMHEMGLCEAVLAVVRDVSDDEPVRRVRLRIGRLQGVVPDVFDSCWRMVAHDTGAAGAALELAEVPVRVRCRACGAESDLASAAVACPGCGAVSVDVTGGDELVVEEVELADGEVRRNPAVAATAGA